MSPILISIVVVLVVVFAVAIRMDMKRRHLNDTQSGGVMGKASRQLRLEGKDKGSQWGAGGG
jgi:hypothetical protein